MKMQTWLQSDKSLNAACWYPAIAASREGDNIKQALISATLRRENDHEVLTECQMSDSREWQTGTWFVAGYRSNAFYPAKPVV